MKENSCKTGESHGYFEELDLDIPEDGTDIAHRVGKKTRVEDGSMQQSMKVKLHSWMNKVTMYHA